MSVKATFKDKPVRGVMVYLFRSMGNYPSSFSLKMETGQDGFARFRDVSEGEYYIVASTSLENPTSGNLFGYFGGNSVHLNSFSERKIILPLVEYGEKPDRKNSDESMIAGRVLHRGLPVEGCYIYAFTDDSSQFRNPTDAIMAVSGEKGFFEMSLPPGKYFIVGKKRVNRGFAGPLKKGDFFGFFPWNSLTVGKDERVDLNLHLIMVKMRNEPLYSSSGAGTIQGKIVDSKGQPVEGVYAALYDNPELLNRPIIISSETGPDGLFFLHAPRAGKFYLGARTGYGGAPRPGDLYGRYEGSLDHSVEVKNGQRLTGIEIQVSEVW